jgi:hypothetical protein
MTLDLSWFRPKPYVQQRCAQDTVLLCTVMLVEGATSVAERRPGLQVLDVLIEASANTVVKAESVCLIVVRRPPAAGGLALLL